MFGFFTRLFQYFLPLFLQRFHFCLIAGDGFLHLLLTLPDILTFSLPVTLVAHDVLQVLVTLNVFAAHNFRRIGNDIFGQTYLAGYLDGKRTARIAYLQLEKRLHQVAVVEHGSVHDSFVVLGKVFQILIMSRDNTESPLLIETLQYSLGNGTANLRLRPSTKFINENETATVALLHHDFHVRQMGRIGTQIVFYRLLVTDINEDTAENTYVATFMHRYGQSALQHILQQPHRFQADRLSSCIRA